MVHMWCVVHITNGMKSSCPIPFLIPLTVARFQLRFRVQPQNFLPSILIPITADKLKVNFDSDSVPML